MKFCLLFTIVCCFTTRINGGIVGSSMGSGSFLLLTKTMGPFPAIVAVGVGKASLAGTRKYCETEDVSQAAEAALESCINSTATVFQTAAGLASSGAGLLKDLYDGKNPKESILNRTKEALDYIPGGQVLKVMIDFGDGFAHGNTTEDMILKKTKDSVENLPGGKFLQVGIDISSDYYLKGETPRDIIVKRGKEGVVYFKEELERDPEKLGNATLTGANIVLWLFIGPVKSKVAVEIGRAAIDGARTYKRTNSFTEASKAAAESAKNSASSAYKNVVGVASSGAGLVRDLYDGKDARTSFVNRTKQALDFVPGGQVLKVGIDFGDGYLQGKSPQDIIIKKTKEALENVPGGKALQFGVDIGSDYYLNGESTKNIIMKNGKEAISAYVGIKQLSIRRQASGKLDSTKAEPSGKGKGPAIESTKEPETKLKKSKSKQSKPRRS